MNYIDYTTQRSFRTAPDGAFTARTEDFFHSNPVYNITRIACTRLVETAHLDMPDGYDMDTLDRVSWMAGYPDQDFHVSGRQATELAQIGAQLLLHNEQGQVQPPMNTFEVQSVSHLVQLVERTVPRQ